MQSVSLSHVALQVCASSHLKPLQLAFVVPLAPAPSHGYAVIVDSAPSSSTQSGTWRKVLSSGYLHALTTTASPLQKPEQPVPAPLHCMRGFVPFVLRCGS